MLAAPTAAPSTTATTTDAAQFRLLRVDSDDQGASNSATRGKTIEVRAFTVDGPIAALRTTRADNPRTGRFVQQVSPNSIAMKNIITAIVLRALRYDCRGIELIVLHPFEAPPREQRSVTVPHIVDVAADWRTAWPDPSAPHARGSFTRLLKLVELITNCSHKSRTSSTSGDLLASSEDASIALQLSRHLDRLAK